MRMTALNKGEYFRYNGIIYKKLEDREKGNNVENMSTGEVYSLPLMLTVDKITKEEAEKPAKKEKKIKPEPIVELTEPVEPTLKPRTFPDIIID